MLRDNSLSLFVVSVREEHSNCLENREQSSQLLIYQNASQFSERLVPIKIIYSCWQSLVGLRSGAVPPAT